jgi:hypothetical protein
MKSAIKTAWIDALRNNTYPPSELKIRTAYGYDPLGVLVEMFRTSSYTLPDGFNTTVATRLGDLYNSRAALIAAIGANGVVLTPDPALNNLRNAAFWATLVLTPANKLQVTNDQDDILLEAANLAVVSAGIPAVETEYDVYKADLDAWIALLDSLIYPGGWMAYKEAWETVDWVLDSSNLFYSYVGVTDHLPEAVQRWSGLQTANPTLEVTDSTFGVTTRVKLTVLVDGVLHKFIAPSSSRRYTAEEIINLLDDQIIASPDATFTLISGGFTNNLHDNPVFEVTEQVQGDTYSWQVLNGSISGSDVLPTVTVLRGSAGTMTVSCTVTRLDMTDTKSLDCLVTDFTPPPPPGGGGGGN